MSNSYYEIVELADGEIALQRVDGDGEPLVRVSFSDEVKFYLQEQCVDVAKAMINTGIKIVGQIQEEDMPEEDSGRTLH
ncbi:MAG: hypothetical protein H6995_05045 [Pseudomonadales bacterium]|nr:hypothetical protein [Pseudomonadales bacterium]MCP5214353.1 hypothetical protein [Pseudomonadales bacterium]MCP5303356.1 hypothetical protein [Pseudomonadales bacterium]